MPFSMGLPIFDEATGKYVTRKPAAEPVKKLNHTPVRLREMTPFHKGYDAIHKNKRARMAAASGKARHSSTDLESEPEYNRSRLLGSGDGRNARVYNPYTRTYERLSFNEFGTYESQTENIPSARPGNYGIVHGTAQQKGLVRQKNGGLSADNPVVLFPGEPLAVAARKARELEKKFPGIPLDKALGQKKRKMMAEKQNQPAKKIKTSTAIPHNKLESKVDLAAWFEHNKGSSQGSYAKKLGNMPRARRLSPLSYSAISTSRTTAMGLLSPPQSP